MGTIVSFRIGQNDVESLGKYFHPTFDSDDLLRVPNHNTIVRTLIGGIPTQPFSMATLPPLGTPRPRLAIALKQLSSAKYGRPRSVVSDEITKRMTTKDALSAGSGAGAPGLAAGSSARPKPKPAPSGSSFLDDWLSKRQGFQNTPPPAAAAPSAAAKAATNKPAAQARPTPAAPAQPAKKSVPPNAASAPKKPQSPQQPPKKSPATAPPAAAPEPQSTKNISSDELAKHEVDKIAAELKQELDTSTPSPPDKLSSGSEVHPTEGDTIFIDHDGSFHLADDLKKTSSS
jgi:hypothetical protein